MSLPFSLSPATDRRRLLLARIKFLDPLVAPNLLIHILALSLLLWIWGISLARAHTFTLFSFHPVFMSLGCVLFMTEGILVSRREWAGWRDGRIGGREGMRF